MDSNSLKEYGIDVGLLVSGLFGAILLTSKGSAMNLPRTISSLIGGAASANYITPIVVNLAKLDNTHYHYGIAFLLGFLGLKGIEYFSKKLLPDDIEEISNVVENITQQSTINKAVNLELDNISFFSISEEAGFEPTTVVLKTTVLPVKLFLYNINNNKNITTIC